MTIRDRINGQLVVLAPLNVADAPAWARWLNDPETTRYLYGRRGAPEEQPTVDQMLEWGRRMLADPWRMAVGLEARGGGTVIGNARLTPHGPRRARFSIVIGEAEHRGRGTRHRGHPDDGPARDSSGSICARSCSTSTPATRPAGAPT